MPAGQPSQRRASGQNTASASMLHSAAGKRSQSSTRPAGPSAAPAPSSQIVRDGVVQRPRRVHDQQRLELAQRVLATSTCRSSSYHRLLAPNA